MRLRIHRGPIAVLPMVVAAAFTLATGTPSRGQDCGDTVLSSMILTADLDCSTSTGLILGDGVTLDCDGHRVSGARLEEQYGIYVRDASNVSVRNCTVERFEVGIRLRSAENTVLQSNVTRANTRYGIELTQSSADALIEGNEILDNEDEGIHVSGPLERAASHSILGNLIDGNASEGIYLLESNATVIADNDIRDHGKAGIYVKKSDRNLIDRNILTGNPIQLADGSRLNAITDNSVTNSSVGISIESSGTQDRSRLNVVTDNTLSGNSVGIFVEGERNTVRANRVTNSAIGGVAVLGTENAFSCNWVAGNPIGLYFAEGATLNTVTSNSIAGNGIGLDATDLPPAAPAVDATDNWWGCAEGPGSPECDPAIGNVDASAPAVAEPQDADGDAIGDTCDTCTDTDGDGFSDPGFPASTWCLPVDNCPADHNPDQEDGDADEVGNACDPCPFDADDDSDGDGICGDADTCPRDPDDDTDGDAVCGDIDNCPADHNPDQRDADGDAIGDPCDTCTDTDGDGFSDPGFPASTWCLPVDNCPNHDNSHQADTDGDAIGDSCDSCTDTDDDGFANPGFPASSCSIDNCPVIPNPDQLDDDGNGVGDVCECAAQSPGRCIAGGGKKNTDCLVEFNTTGPISLNRKGTKVKQRLRCSDGDPLCDRDGLVDGQCTFGVTVCLGNADPRLARRCQPLEIRSIEVRRPRPDAARSGMDRDNAFRLEQVLSTAGLGIRRHGEIVLAGSETPPGMNTCSPLVELVVPAPSSAQEKAVKRNLHVDGFAADGRRDRDRILLKCAAAPVRR